MRDASETPEAPASASRVEDLEVRMAWYERQIAELDGVVRELFDQVARLQREVQTLSEASSPELGPAIDRPPHY